MSWSQGLNPLWPHLLHFCWLCFHLLFKLPCLHLPHPAPNPPTHPQAPCFQGDRLHWGEVYGTSPKLCKAESEASHLQISKERMLSRSENIFKGSMSVTQHQGQRWEMWAKAKPEIISDATPRPFTKGLQLRSPRVPLSLSLSLPSSLGTSLRCRSQASSSRDHSRSELGPHQALPSGHLRAGVEGGVGRLRGEGSSGEELHRGRRGQTTSGRRSKLRQGEGPQTEQTACKWPRDEGAGG